MILFALPMRPGRSPTRPESQRQTGFERSQSPVGRSQSPTAVPFSRSPSPSTLSRDSPMDVLPRIEGKETKSLEPASNSQIPTGELLTKRIEMESRAIEAALTKQGLKPEQYTIDTVNQVVKLHPNDLFHPGRQAYSFYGFGVSRELKFKRSHIELELHLQDFFTRYNQIKENKIDIPSMGLTTKEMDLILQNPTSKYNHLDSVTNARSSTPNDALFNLRVKYYLAKYSELRNEFWHSYRPNGRENMPVDIMQKVIEIPETQLKEKVEGIRAQQKSE